MIFHFSTIISSKARPSTPFFLGSSEQIPNLPALTFFPLGLSQQIYKVKIGRTNSWIRTYPSDWPQGDVSSIGSFYPKLLGTKKMLLKNPASDYKTSKNSQAVSQNHNRTPNIVHKLWHFEVGWQHFLDRCLWALSTHKSLWGHVYKTLSVSSCQNLLTKQHPQRKVP